MDETYIFHETQEGLLCGQHCLNNLLQQTLFTAVDLSEIAIRLDETEREMLATSDGDAPVGRRSEHVDNTGNFSFEVLQFALKLVCDVELISWTGEEGRERGDPAEESGYIINRHKHWFAIRKIKDHWWNLDSLLDRPQHVSPFYLTAMLSQFREEGCSVFLIRGALLEAGVYRFGDHDAAQWVVWWRESQLLPSANTLPSQQSNTHAYQTTGSDDEDLMLAIAMSQSLE